MYIKTSQSKLRNSLQSSSDVYFLSGKYYNQSVQITENIA